MSMLIVLSFLLLVFVAGLLCALANMIIRQQEVALEPSVESAEEEEEEE